MNVYFDALSEIYIIKWLNYTNWFILMYNEKIINILDHNDIFANNMKLIFIISKGENKNDQQNRKNNTIRKQPR